MFSKKMRFRYILHKTNIKTTGNPQLPFWWKELKQVEVETNAFLLSNAFWIFHVWRWWIGDDKKWRNHFHLILNLQWAPRSKWVENQRFKRNLKRFFVAKKTEDSKYLFKMNVLPVRRANNNPHKMIFDSIFIFDDLDCWWHLNDNIISIGHF